MGLILGALSSCAQAYVTSDDVRVHQTVGTPVLPPPPPPPGGVGGGGSVFLWGEEPSAATFLIGDVRIDADTESAVVSWTTTLPSVGTVRWGRGDTYGLGQLVETSFATVHAVSIEGLEPGTQYVLSVVARDAKGNSTVKNDILFRTDRLPDTTPPANVSNFTAVWQSPTVKLSWQNPDDGDFARVRLVRSDIFFPEDPYDGFVIYEGRKESVDDSWVTPGTIYYYALFAEDESGNYSSGALARIRIPIPSEPTSPSEDEDVFGDTGSSPDDADVPHEIKGLSIDNFRFVQNGKDADRNGSTMRVDGLGNLEISLGYDSVPEVLKTIGITLTDPNDPSKTFPFLLRVNKEKTAYTATIAPLTRPGIYRVSATVLDYKHQVLKQVDGKIVVLGPTYEEETSFIGLSSYCTSELNWWRFLLCYGWVALLIILIILISSRKRKKRTHIYI